MLSSVGWEWRFYSFIVGGFIIHRKYDDDSVLAFYFQLYIILLGRVLDNGLNGNLVIIEQWNGLCGCPGLLMNGQANKIVFLDKKFKYFMFIYACFIFVSSWTARVFKISRLIVFGDFEAKCPICWFLDQSRNVYPLSNIVLQKAVSTNANKTHVNPWRLKKSIFTVFAFPLMN